MGTGLIPCRTWQMPSSQADTILAAAGLPDDQRPFSPQQGPAAAGAWRLLRRCQRAGDKTALPIAFL